MSIVGKVALITGASSGIGKAIATTLAQAGVKVAVNYANSHRDAEGVQEWITGHGGIATTLRADVSVEGEVRVMVAKILEEWGRLDILVNNAGVVRDGLLMRLSVTDWDTVMAVNLRGAFLCAKHALRPMVRQQSGRIINVASISGILGNAGQASYAASKAGLIGLTKVIAQEYAHKGVTANAIAPGLVDTPMSQALPEEVLRRIQEQVLLKRAAEPEEIAQVALFLASPSASYINGEVLRVDGGIRF